MPRRSLPHLLLLATIAPALAAGALRSFSIPTTRPTTQPTTAPATQPATQTLGGADLYTLSADDFFKRPDVQQRIKKTSVNIPLLETAIFHATNRQRAANDLPLFQYSAAMNLMARRHSAEMGVLQFFDHVSPTPANRTLADRLQIVGLVNVTAGENIAVLPAMEMGSGHFISHDPPGPNQVWFDEATGKRVDYYTYQELAQAVANQWKNSPPHWKNILDPKFKYLGTGAARGPFEDKKQDSFYMTQNFCGSLDATAEAKALPLLKP